MQSEQGIQSAEQGIHFRQFPENRELAWLCETDVPREALHAQFAYHYLDLASVRFPQQRPRLAADARSVRRRARRIARAPLTFAQRQRTRAKSAQKSRAGAIPPAPARTFREAVATRVGDVLEVAPVLMRRPSQVPGPAH